MSAHSIFPQCQGVSKDKLQYEGVCSKTLGSGLGNCWNCGYTWCFSTKSIDNKQSSVIDLVLSEDHLLHLMNLRGLLHRLCLLLSCTLYEVNSDLYLDELILWLAIEHGIKVSVSALHSTLVKVGLKNFSPRLLLKGTKNCMNNGERCRWAMTIHHDGSQLVCIHETSKNELTSASKWLCLLWRTCWVERCIFSWRQILTCYCINCWWLYCQQCCSRLLWLNGLPWIHSGNNGVFPDELPQTNTYSWKLSQMNPYLAPQSVLILDN